MSDLTIILTVQELQIVVNALVQRSYGEVFQLVGKIQSQVVAQEAMAKAAEPEKSNFQ